MKPEVPQKVFVVLELAKTQEQFSHALFPRSEPKYATN